MPISRPREIAYRKAQEVVRRLAGIPENGKARNETVALADTLVRDPESFIRKSGRNLSRDYGMVMRAVSRILANHSEIRKEMAKRPTLRSFRKEIGMAAKWALKLYDTNQGYRSLVAIETELAICRATRSSLPSLRFLTKPT